MEQYAILMKEPCANLRRLNRLTLSKHIKSCLMLEAATLAEDHELLERERPTLTKSMQRTLQPNICQMPPNSSY